MYMGFEDGGIIAKRENNIHQRRLVQTFGICFENDPTRNAPKYSCDTLFAFISRRFDGEGSA